MDAYHCKNCGVPRLHTSALTPCSCGETVIIAEMSSNLTGCGGLTASAGIRKMAVRTWRERWEQIQAELPSLLAPESEMLSGPSMDKAHRKFLAFITVCYHLKDALKKELPGSILKSGSQVEDAISQTPALCLLADMANAEKHAGLDQKKYPTKTGAIPKISNLETEHFGGGWRLHVTIECNGTTYDGLQQVQDAVAAWQKLLHEWGLFPP